MKHSFAPLISDKSKVLILGSLPGAKSLELQQYYAYKHNHFWPIMFDIFGSGELIGYKEKCHLLLDNGLALWDVAKSAERKGSGDSQIKNLRPNDIPGLLRRYPDLRFLIFNGDFAFSTYRKCFGDPLLPFRKVLSTSPACAGRLEEKNKMWREAITQGLAII